MSVIYFDLAELTVVDGNIQFGYYKTQRHYHAEAIIIIIIWSGHYKTIDTSTVDISLPFLFNWVCIFFFSEIVTAFESGVEIKPKSYFQGQSYQ